jgi:PEGA domain
MRRCVWILVALASAAHADDRDDARHEFAAGQAADKARDWQNAIEHYLRAYDLAPHPFALYNVAADYEQLGQLREAARYYAQYIANARDVNDRVRVERLVGDLRVRPAKLSVKSTPSGARVAIDGQPAGVTPFTGAIGGGRHRITVESDADRQDKQVTVEFAEPVDVELALRGANGTLVVAGAPAQAQVTIDGERAGGLPLAIAIPSGRHHIAVAADGYTPYEVDAQIEPNTPKRLDVSLDKAPDPTPIGGYMLAGVGGAGLNRADAIYGLEVGWRTGKHELSTVAGKLGDDDFLTINYRYAFVAGALTPFVGGGYLGTKSDHDTDTSSGAVVEAGLRYDVLHEKGSGLALRASTGVYVFSATDSTTMMKSTRVVVPISLTLELTFGLGHH